MALANGEGEWFSTVFTSQDNAFYLDNEENTSKSMPAASRSELFNRKNRDGRVCAGYVVSTNPCMCACNAMRARWYPSLMATTLEHPNVKGRE